MREIYLKRVLEQIPRLLSQQDRCRESQTYGCFDRNYWHYKIIDFPCARHQEASYTLALLYTIDSEINPYYKNERIKEWAIAGINFWKKIHAGDEWYFNEHSFVSTSFSTLGVVEAYYLLNLNDEALETSFIKSINWILERDEPLVANQMAGSILAIETVLQHQFVYLSEAISFRLNKFLSRQKEEGWFSEYGGFDVGYSYILLDYLARLWQKTQNSKIKESAYKLIDFLSYFIHPDGTTGKYYTSRNTQYIIPSGLEIFSENPIAKAIANIEIKNLQKNSILWDDRYLCYQLYYHLLAYLNYKETNKKPERLPYEKKFSRYFNESKLFVESDGEGYYHVRNLNDNRYIEFRNFKCDNSTPLKYSKSVLPNPYLTILMRIFQLSFGRSNFFSKLIKTILRKFLILRKGGKSNIYVPSAGYF